MFDIIIMTFFVAECKQNIQFQYLIIFFFSIKLKHDMADNTGRDLEDISLSAPISPRRYFNIDQVKLQLHQRQAPRSMDRGGGRLKISKRSEKEALEL